MKRRYKLLNGALLLLVLALAGLAIALSHDSPCGAAYAPVPAGASSMKAAVHRCYGPPDVVVKIEDLPKPEIADDRVLVKVHAAAVNPLDWHMVRGSPYLVRLDAGIGAPASVQSGADFAGTVEAIGKNVTAFKPGDEVFGARDGAFAQYVNVREKGAIVLKPAGLAFEQAAAVPIAALTALQALRDQGKVQPGQKVLINGASGGVGTFAVQIAKVMGANVTAVASTRNLELVRGLGADQVVDYTHEDFTRSSLRYDLILDLVGNRALLDVRQVMQPKGIYIGIGGGSPEEGGFLGPMTGALEEMVLSRFVSQSLVFFVADTNQKDLAELAGWLQSGKIMSVIDKRYPLTEIAAALRYVEQGHSRGKVIITVD
jgi:NADPH:quinone reductase-like Zn-dependent oxidoreductase